MKKLIIIMLLCVLTLASATVESVNDPHKEIEYFVLENGLQVYLLSNDKATNTNIAMTINVGWDIEDDNHFGLTHLVEHMVFRDKRVPHRDYLDYMKDEGASDVNGYTSRYKTELITKIDSNKSYWVAKTFAQMIFDKDVDSKDIEVEKGAVQVEIGQLAWYDKIIAQLAKIKNILPPHENIYQTHFGLQKPKELPSFYLEKVNNEDFTFEQVMKHYEKYYYPSNMILKITGNFDTQKMKSLVIDTYSKYTREGTLRTHKPKRDAKLSHKPYLNYREGLNTNYGYIGVQYLFDDCQKHIILKAFMEYVATKIQQELRNKNGKTYSVSTHSMQSRGAGVISVAFDGLHDDFDDNIKLVEKSIKYYVEHIDASMIDEALEEYKKRYTTLEFDSDSLENIVDKAEHMRSDHHIEKKTHYDFFRTITPEKFRTVLKETFIPENAYRVLYRDYYLFPNDYLLLSFLILLLIIFIYFRFSHIIFYFRGILYEKRDVILSQRVGNQLVGFLTFIFVIYTTGFIYKWFEYIVLKYLIGNVNYLQEIDIPYGFYIEIASNLLPFIIMFILLRWIIHYHSRIDVTEDRLYILGGSPFSIEKDEVVELEVVPWRIDKLFQIIGFAFFFWRPLLKLKTKRKTYYIRSSNAKALKEDLTKRWLGDKK
jgi:predicted Zn-dependent peptidase